MEKIKALLAVKKVRIIGLISLVALLVIVLIVAFAANGYKRQVKALIKAAKNEEKIEKFVKTKMNLRALYALEKADYDSDKKKVDESSFKEAYKEAEKDDYLSDEVVESQAKSYNKQFEDDDDNKWVVKKIGDLKKTTKDDGRLNLKGMKRCKVVLENKKADKDDDKDKRKVELRAYFYKGKIIGLIPEEAVSFLGL